MARDGEHILLSQSEVQERMLANGRPLGITNRMFGVIVRYAVQQTRQQNGHKITARDVAYRVEPKSEGLKGWVVSVSNLADEIPAMTAAHSSNRELGGGTIELLQELVDGFESESPNDDTAGD